MSEMFLTIETMWWLFVRGILLLIVVGFMSYAQAAPFQVDETHLLNFTLSQYHVRFLSSERCFAYADRARVYPGIIDGKKFTDKTANDCVQREGFSSRITLVLPEETKHVYNNKDAFLLDSRLCFSARYSCMYDEQVVPVYNEKGDQEEGTVQFFSVIHHE